MFLNYTRLVRHFTSKLSTTPSFGHDDVPGNHRIPGKAILAFFSYMSAQVTRYFESCYLAGDVLIDAGYELILEGDAGYYQHTVVTTR